MGSLALDRSVPRSVRTSAARFRMVDASTILRFACTARKCVSYTPGHWYLLPQNEHVTGIMQFGATDLGSPVWVKVV